MTDARLPERLLNDRRFLRLSPHGMQLWVMGLLWSVANRTDGVLDADDLAMIPRVDQERAVELEKLNLWERDGDRWLILDFNDTQTPRAQLEGLEHRRRQDRERASRYRENRKRRDSSRDDKGQDRQGQDRQGTYVGRDDEKPEADDGWPTPAVPGDCRCLACDEPIDPVAGRVHPGCDVGEPVQPQ